MEGANSRNGRRPSGYEPGAMAATDPAVERPTTTRTRGPDEGAVAPAEVPRGGWRDRIRTKPGLGLAYRAAVFMVGAALIGLGFALAVLPGPLTIPPVLLGLWIWSTEFRFAQKLFDSFQERARIAWAHAKAHPLSSTIVTIGGLAAAASAAWAVSHFGLIDRARDLIGI
jgi:uncharacterized membrane protein YbaN (DUF454 family)